MKTKILMLLIFSMVSIFTIEAQNYVTLFTDCYFKGNDFKMNAGSYYLSQTRIGQGNLSSIKVPAGMRITLFTGAEPGYGDKKQIASDVMCLSYLDWNDKAVTAVVEEINNNNNNGNWNNNNNNNNNNGNYNNGNNGGGNNNTNNGNYNNNNNGNNGGGNNNNWNNENKTLMVAFFLNSGYGGERLDYSSTGLFTLQGKNFDHNISSMYVRPGYMITVYDQDGWKGNSRTFTEDDSNLNRVGWNDKIRSFMVSRK